MHGHTTTILANLTRAAVGVALAAAVSACDTRPPVNHTEPALMLLLLYKADPMAPLTDAEFASLEPDQQYRVANRFLSAMYSGVGADEFFHLSAGIEARQARPQFGRFLSNINQVMLAPMDAGTKSESEGRAYGHDVQHRGQGEPLAVLHEFPVSRERTNAWMAYVLANSVWFSPAYELDTVEANDMARVYDRLLAGIEQDRLVRDIVYDHMISQENWRRFRSPEDNTREMMEIYNGHFVDADVPKASRACQNWSLSRKGELVIGADRNTEPQTLSYGATVTSCEDFYRSVADNPMLIPVLSYVLVDHFFAGRSEGEKYLLAYGVIIQKPRTVREVFQIILNSKAFLLTSDRGKFFEEAFYNFRAKTGWRAPDNFFKSLPKDLKNMNQDLFELKLGRENPVPLDTLSLANFHNKLRNSAALDRSNGSDDGGWDVDRFTDLDIPDEQYVRFLFLSILEREPRSEETETLESIFADEGYSLPKHRTQITQICFDYFTRLPELYVYRKVF